MGKMVFQAKGFHVELVENNDIATVLEVYNSNDHFLIKHLGKNQVTNEWIFQELESMRDVGFYSCKIVEKSTGKIIGIIDFKVTAETYLSLLMIHHALQGKGLGKLIFEGFEEYINSLKSQSIRIDVVTSYDYSVLNFWLNNGFIKCKNVELNWSGMTLSAVTMKKYL